MDDLRESGDIEQDAHLILGLQTNVVDERAELKISILKNRNGISGESTSLEFERPILKITDQQSPFIGG